MLGTSKGLDSQIRRCSVTNPVIWAQIVVFECKGTWFITTDANLVHLEKET